MSTDDPRLGEGKFVHYGVYLLVNGTIRGSCIVEGMASNINDPSCAIPGPFTLQPGDLVQLRIDRLDGNQPAGAATWDADFGPVPPPAPDPWD